MRTAKPNELKENAFPVMTAAVGAVVLGYVFDKKVHPVPLLTADATNRSTTSRVVS